MTTEKMIPLSAVDTKIKELKELGKEGSIGTGRSCSFAVYVLEEIKKEAISISEPESETFTREQVLKMMDEAEHDFRVAATAKPSPLEQKIKALIKKLEKELKQTESYILEDRIFAQTIIKDQIDELRKLLE